MTDRGGVGARDADDVAAAESHSRCQASRRSADGSVVVLLLAVLVVLAGCADSATRSDADTQASSTSVPAKLVECATDANVAQSQECLTRIYVETVRNGYFPELTGVDDEQLVAFGGGLCSYAQSLETTDPAGRPLFGDLVSSTATSWGVRPKVVEAVYRSTQSFCPEGFKVLQGLSRSKSSIQVELAADGTGQANITYFLPGGDVVQKESVTLPWAQVVHQSEPNSVSMSVAPVSGAKVGCRISVSGVVIDKQRVASELATCDAADEDIDGAVVDGAHRD